ncbi:MAG: NYN domain-containing protein [Phycisphaerae bacterium]
MPVLIDGNNLQHAAFDAQPELPVGRVMMCQILGSWASRSAERITVVFDGPSPEGDLLRQFGDSFVTVRFSGHGVSADSVIAQLVEGDSAPRRLVVVSTDRQVAKAARRRRAKAERSDDFWARVTRDLARPRPESLEPPEKRRGVSDAESTGEWMRKLGFDDNPADDDDPLAFR